MAEPKTEPKEPKAPKDVPADSGDMGGGVSPEGVPYQAPSHGHERQLRERSKEDEAHEKHVEERKQELAEAERTQRLA